MADSTAGPLHEMSPTTRFSDRASDYARSRPSYPAAAIDAILEGLGEPSRLAAADVGAGTGISARLLAERGVSVVAIEPNEAMRRAAAPHERVSWRDGSAEATGLAAASVSLVLCAQAFHWFRQEEALAEFARILGSGGRPGGRVALMWNIRDESDDFTRAYGELIDRASAFRSARTWGNDVPALRGSALFRGVRALRFPYRQRHDADDLVRRAMSASYVPKEGAAAAELERELRGLHARYAGADGTVSLVYTTEVYLAESAAG